MLWTDTERNSFNQFSSPERVDGMDQHGADFGQFASPAFSSDAEDQVLAGQLERGSLARQLFPYDSRPEFAKTEKGSRLISGCLSNKCRKK